MTNGGHAPTKGPQGFRSYVTNAGIKDGTYDFVVVISDVPCVVDGVFTKSRFAGPSVRMNRVSVANGRAQALVVNSKNANVANGERGDADAATLVNGVASALSLSPDDVLHSSTGVIGRPLPMDRIAKQFPLIRDGLTDADFAAVARGIMTTDTHPKMVTRSIGNATLVGVAKGVGMIEPNMATLLTYFFTDAQLPHEQLSPLFRRTIDKTFNCLSIDSDTSTSDTALLYANGLAGPVDVKAFETGLYEAALELVKMVAADGEGATKIIEVTCDGARDYEQAKRVAKSIVNSPLVKTAVHGADPNWGRIAMAIGKCDDDLDIDQNRTSIYIGGIKAYPSEDQESALAEMEAAFKADEVKLRVNLGIGEASATVWGCDLSDGYVRINADYTT